MTSSAGKEVIHFVCDKVGEETEHLSDEEELRLALLAQNGDDQAKGQLIDYFFPFIESKVEHYLGHGVGKHDLTQDGLIGLLHAIETFHPKKCDNFYFYAEKLITESLIDAVSDQAGNSRTTRRLLESIEDIRLAEERLKFKLNRPPTTDEIGDYLELPSGYVETVIHSVPRGFTPLGCYTENSIETINDRKQIPGGRDKSEPPIEKDDIEETLDDIVKSILLSLTPEERKVIRMSFGFDDGRRSSVADISKAVGISKEEVRQIEERAVEKLRSYFR